MRKLRNGDTETKMFTLFWCQKTNSALSHKEKYINQINSYLWRNILLTRKIIFQFCLLKKNHFSFISSFSKTTRRLQIYYTILTAMKKFPCLKNFLLSILFFVRAKLWVDQIDERGKINMKSCSWDEK